jgi:hypothetical protein
MRKDEQKGRKGLTISLFIEEGSQRKGEKRSRDGTISADGTSREG